MLRPKEDLYARLRLLRAISVKLARLKGTGLPRISERLRAWHQKHWQGGEVEISDYKGSLRLAVDLCDHMGSRIFWFDSYSGTEVNLVKKLLRAGDVFIDVGANIGEFTLPAARLVGPNGKVIAIEPVPAIRAKLERHIQWNGLAPAITVVAEAIGDHEGSASIFGPPYDAQERHDGLPTMFSSAERPLKIAEVRQTTLDVLWSGLGLEKISGIKLDIEGAELPALRGGIDVLKRFRPWLLCEIGTDTCEAAGYTPWELVELLLSLGYRVSQIRESGLTDINCEQDLSPWQNVLAQVE